MQCERGTASVTIFRERNFKIKVFFIVPNKKNKKERKQTRFSKLIEAPFSTNKVTMSK